MQHRRPYYSRSGVLLMTVIGMAVGVVAVLAAKDIPMPAAPVEKTLDASAFIKP